MKTNHLSLINLSLILALFALINTAKAQPPCFSIKNNNTTCNAEVSWETVDGSHNTVGGSTNVTLPAGNTIYISGSACTGAADIHVSLILWNGTASGQIQSVNGVIWTPIHNFESGNNGTTCSGGNWNVDWNTGNPVLIY